MCRSLVASAHNVRAVADKRHNSFCREFLDKGSGQLHKGGNPLSETGRENPKTGGERRREATAADGRSTFRRASKPDTGRR